MKTATMMPPAADFPVPASSGSGLGSRVAHWEQYFDPSRFSWPHFGQVTRPTLVQPLPRAPTQQKKDRIVSIRRGLTRREDRTRKGKTMPHAPNLLNDDGSASMATAMM